MGAVRMRFSKEERELLADSLANGTEIEALCATRWRTARATGEITSDRDGYQSALGVNLTHSATFASGETVTLTPKHVRAIRPAAQA